VAALENCRPTPAESGGIKKHYSSYNRTSGSRRCLSPSLYLPFFLILALGHARPSCASDVPAEKWEMIVARFRGACLKFMNDFTATSPIATRHKRASRAISRKKGGERAREWERVRLWPTFATIHQYRIAREQERERERRARTPRNILIVEFSVRAAYPLEPLCPLPGADLLIINYSDHQVHPTLPPLSSRLLRCNICGCVSKLRSFFIAVAILTKKL